MAEAASRASTKTKLVLYEGVETEIGLFAATQKPGAVAGFDSAGPKGGVLKAEVRAAAVEAGAGAQVDAPVKSDPLADDPGSDAPPPTNGQPASPATTAEVEGEYRRVLVEDGTGEVVMPEQVRRGLRTEDGAFIDLTEQVNAIEERTQLEEMRVVSFIDVGQVPRTRVMASYYVGVADDPAAAKPLRLIFEAMRERRRAAVVKWTKTSRQALGVLVADGRTGTLMALQLAWAEDFRPAPAKALATRAAEVTEREVAVACELVDAMSDTRESLDELRDDAIALREELIARAQAGEMEPVVIEPVEEVEAMPDLESAMTNALAHYKQQHGAR